MGRYVIRRLIQSIPIFFGITILAYMLMTAAPGGPVRALAFDPKISAEDREQLATKLGVNDPWPVQYLRWLIGDDWLRWDSDDDGVADQAFLIPLDTDGDGEPEAPGIRKGVLRGDFGRSFVKKRPVLDILLERLPATLELSISSLLIGTSVGILIGLVSAVRRGSLFDNSSRVLAVFLQAIPNFWLGLLMILFFGATLGWLPLQGRCPTTIDDTCGPIYTRLNYLIMPVALLSFGPIAGFSRYARASMLDVIGQDYVRTARAKGLPERAIWLKHGARNAMIPIATFIGPAIFGLLGGAVITEQIFSFPGVGKLSLDAVLQRDYPVVMAVTIYAALSTILGYLLSDILYGIIDPRIRY
jgi:peptide/nickel transport system permease protein